MKMVDECLDRFSNRNLNMIGNIEQVRERELLFSISLTSGRIWLVGLILSAIECHKVGSKKE